MVICDDAYYGMFFDPACERESLFGRLAQAHPNLLAVKVDGATKEAFVWGLRVGFITFGVANGTPAVYKALEDKTAGADPLGGLQRHPSRPDHRAERPARPRFPAAAGREGGASCAPGPRPPGGNAASPNTADCWDVYPYNSGYFMCLRLKDADAEPSGTGCWTSTGSGPSPWARPTCGWPSPA